MSACGFAARLRFVASLLACFAGKRFAFPQLRTLAGSKPSTMGPKTKGPHSWEPIKPVVGDEGCPRAAGAARSRFGPAALACCAGKRFAFPQLRTLAGSNPMHRAQKRKASIIGGLTIQWWAMRDVRVRLAPPALASGLRPSRAALENASRFLSSAPLRVRIPCAGHKQKRSPCEDRFKFSGGR